MTITHMLDQAHDLRQLATRCQPAETPCCRRRPALVVVAGGKGGVGTTSVAIGLATAVAKTGRHSVLIDADSRGDVALLCGVEERYTLADVLAGRRTWTEALCTGPTSVKVIVGQRGWQDGRNPTAAATHLIEQLNRQPLPAELAVIDAGNRLDGPMPHLCGKADALVMVTTGDVASVVGTFASIKAVVQSRDYEETPLHRHGGGLFLLVNMASSARVAEIVYYRLARTCRRVLGVELQSAGRLRIARRTAKKSWADTIGLNLQVALADTLRGVSAAGLLSN